jgi:GMP synthase PP-ATPase subunit
VRGCLRGLFIEVFDEEAAKLKDACDQEPTQCRLFAFGDAAAVFLPVMSVGVTGDGRRHEPVIALRAADCE